MKNKMTNAVTGEELTELPGIICIYHANCLDGFGAAWAVRHWVKDIRDVVFVAANHGDEPPDVTDECVVIVDFSYKRRVIEKMMESCKKLLIIDHHKTAAEELEFLPDHEDLPSLNASKIFNMDRSGAGLVWEFYNEMHNKPMPPLLKAIERGDLWDFSSELTKPVTSALRSYPYDFDVWDRLMEPSRFGSLVKEGEAILRRQQKDLHELLPGITRKIGIAGFIVPIANLPYTFASDAGHTLAEDHPFAGTFSVTNGDVLVSLRSREDGEDVGAIAQQYGGGGHKHASGFRVELKEFCRMLL